MDTSTTNFQCEKSESVIELPVVRQDVINNKSVYIVRLSDERELPVSLYSFQENEPVPQMCTCWMKETNDGEIVLEQDKYALLKSLYKENNSYTFKVISRETDSNTGGDLLILMDSYGISHITYLYHRYLEEEIKIQTGYDINCLIRKIDPRGFLNLSICSSQSVVGVFVTAERLFEEIGFLPDIDTWFYNIKPLMSALRLQDFAFANLFKEYEARENLWIFSYLGFLEYQISKNKTKDIVSLEKYVAIYCALENWLLDGSDFSLNFSLDKRVVIRQKAETNLKRMTFLLEAIHLVINHKDLEFIRGLIHSSMNSGYIRNRSDNFMIVCNILALNSELLQSEVKSVIFLISIFIRECLLDEKEITYLIFLLDLNVKQLPKDKRCLLLKLQLTGVLVLLFKELKDAGNFVIRKSSFFRFVNQLTGNSTLEYSVKSLLKVGEEDMDVGFDWNELIYDDILNQPLIAPFTSHNKLIKQGKQTVIAEGGNLIFISSKGITLLSANQVEAYEQYLYAPMNSFCKLLGDKLKVGSINNRIRKKDETSSFIDQNREWKKLFRSNQKAPVPLKGSVLPVTVNEVSESGIMKLSVSFLGLTGSMSANNLCKWGNREIKLLDIFKPGQTFIAEVSSESSEQIEFSLSKLLWTVARHNYKIGDVVKAKLVSCTDRRIIYWVTEDGFCGYSNYLGAVYTLKLGGVYKVKVKSFQDTTQIIELELLNLVVGYTFKVSDALRDTIKNKLTKDLFPVPEKNVLPPVLAKRWSWELLHLVDNEIAGGKHTRQELFDLFQTGKLLASWLKSNLSYYYMGKLCYMMTVDSFCRDDSFDCLEVDFDMIAYSENLLMTYPDLKTEKDTLQLLSYYHSPNPVVTDLLYDRLNGENSRLAELILASNLLYKNGADPQLLHLVKKEIVALLDNEIDTDLLNLPQSQSQSRSSSETQTPPPVKEEEPAESDSVDLGYESTVKEFKTSIVYPANSCDIPDMPTQMDVILRTIAAFLNSKGGTLFIGVNDDGSIRGLQPDFLYLNGGIDLYERVIRKAVVDNFNKDINGLLEFRFHTSKTLTYCEIEVPAYEKPVSYKLSFWQRQGNETRILRGSDLTDFIKRRFPSYPVDGVVKTCDIKTFLVVNEDGSYMLTEQEPLAEAAANAKVVPLYHSYSNGFVLFGYSNGRVNKVPIRFLMSKNRDTLFSGEINTDNKLILVEAISEHMLLLIHICQKGAEYVKVYDTANISPRSDVRKKGNVVVTAKKDEVKMYTLLNNKHRRALKSIFYLSPAPLGMDINKDKCKEAIEYLRNLHVTLGETK